METEIKTKSVAKNYNKPVYVLFVMIAVIFMFLKDFSQAMMFSGLALVFDPFNPTTPFPKRPTYQKVWFVAHILVTFTLFALMFIWK